jgi:hypothetical protein
VPARLVRMRLVRAARSRRISASQFANARA